MNDLTLNIMGFNAVNKDLMVELRDPATDSLVRSVRPFLDGTVKVPQMPPGRYELRVRHPNLTLPVVRRPIRVLPVGDTKVSVLIDPSQFRDTPIEDIPEANLAPVRQIADGIAEDMVQLSTKQPGEAIKAQDWNRLAGAIGDLAQAVTELTRLVSPTGHDHPELIDKFDEVSGNFRRLLETLSAAMTELQRQIQSLRFRRVVNEVLDGAGVAADSTEGREMLDLVGRLETDAVRSPTEFSRTARNVGVQLGTKLERLIEQNQDRAEFIESDGVKNLTKSVELLRRQRTTSYDNELAHHRRTDRELGGGLKFIG